MKLIRRFHHLFVLLAIFWATKDFNTLSNAVDFINKLPENQREKAYVIALNSARSSMLNGYYSVVFPEWK